LQGGPSVASVFGSGLLWLDERNLLVAPALVSSASFIKVSFAFVIQFELRIRLDDFTALLLFLDRLLAWRR